MPVGTTGKTADESHPMLACDPESPTLDYLDHRRLAHLELPQRLLLRFLWLRQTRLEARHPLHLD